MTRLYLILLLSISQLPAQELEFYEHILPFLKDNCISCHNKTTTKAGLNMETPDLMKAGGDSGPALLPGEAEKSLIVLASQHQKDMEMPPPNNKSGASNLSTSEIETLKKWINAGAKTGTPTKRQVTLQTMTTSITPIYTLAVTTDGRYAACGRGNDLFLYDLATHELVSKAPKAHRGLVQSLTFSPDGKTLVSGSYREVKFWSLIPSSISNSPIQPSQKVDDALLKSLADTAKSPVTTAHLSPKSDWVLSAHQNGSCKVWQRSPLKPLFDLKGQMKAQTRLQELEHEKAAQTLEQSFHTSEISRLETERKALETLLQKAKEAITAMQKVLPEKRKNLAPAIEAKKTAEKALADAKSKQQANPKDSGLTKEVQTAQDKLITTSMTQRSAEAAVQAAESNIQDAEEDVKRITTAQTQITEKIQSSQSASAAAKKRLDLIKTEATPLETAMAQPPGPIKTLAWTADGKRAVAWLLDGTLRMWSAVTGQVLKDQSLSTSTPSLRMNADGSITASQTQSVTIGTSLQIKESITLQAPDLFSDRVHALRFSPDGKKLATGSGEPSRSGDVHLFDAKTGKLLNTWREIHTDSVLALDFSPDGHHLATASADKTARITEVASGKKVQIFEGHTHYVTSVSYRSDGRILATAGADGIVSIWNLSLGERKKKIEGWTKEITSLQFMGASQRLIASSGDAKLRIFTDEGSEVKSIQQPEDFMHSAASPRGGQFVLAGGEASQLHVWEGQSGRELAHFTR